MRTVLKRALYIGSNRDNDLSLELPWVAPFHLRAIYINDYTISVEDLGSVAGILLNNNRIPTGSARFINPGDIVAVGHPDSKVDLFRLFELYLVSDESISYQLPGADRASDHITSSIREEAEKFSHVHQDTYGRGGSRISDVDFKEATLEKVAQKHRHAYINRYTISGVISMSIAILIFNVASPESVFMKYSGFMTALVFMMCNIFIHKTYENSEKEKEDQDYDYQRNFGNVLLKKNKKYNRASVPDLSSTYMN